MPDVQFYDIFISPKFCVFWDVNQRSSSNEKRDVTDVKSMPNTFILLENAGNYYYWKWRDKLIAKPPALSNIPCPHAVGLMVDG